MKKVLSYLKYTKKEVVLAPLFKMLEVIFELCVPIIVSLIVDVGIANKDVSFIVGMCIVMLVLASLGLVSAVTAQYFSAVAAVRLSTRLRNELLKKIQGLQYSDLDEIGTSTLITRMTSDVNQVQVGVNMTLRLLLRSPVVVIGSIVVAFTISVSVGFIFLLTVPTLFVIVFLIMYFCIPLFDKSQEKIDRVVELSQENLYGLRVIRAFNKQDYEIGNFKEANNSLAKSQIFVGNISSLINPLTYAVINMFIVILLYVSGREVYSGSLTQGNVIALYNLISQILVETIKFASLIITLSKLVTSSKRVGEVLVKESNVDYHNNEGGNSDYIVEFRNVSLNYRHSQKNSLSNISFSVNKGEIVGIIGSTGSGKTTLINALNHFYDINEGTIYFNGIDVASYDVEVLRNKIALVPQKAKLFKGTIRENLLWGNKNATDSELVDALKVAQGYEIISKKARGLDEIVEQNGSNFSGGQKQRLCIARALVKKADILVLDDSSSALDYATDAKLRKSIKEFSKDLTTFIISQRTTSIMGADKILVLDNGELVGVGTHEELLSSCEVYQEIHYSQLKKEM